MTPEVDPEGILGELKHRILTDPCSFPGVLNDLTVRVTESGASADGAAGLGAIKARGGTVFCQAPESSLEPIMPRAGCAATRVDRVASPELLGRELSGFSP